MSRRNVAALLVALTLASFSTAMLPKPAPAPEATYEEVVALPQSPEKLLVDVRTPEEVRDTGVIPTSILVPRKRAFTEQTNKHQLGITITCV